MTDQPEPKDLKENALPPGHFRSVEESLPPNRKIYSTGEVLQGIPEQEGYTTVPFEWGRAMGRQWARPNQSYFAQDPKRLAKFYYFMKSAPEGWEPPAWFDPQKYDQAYNLVREMQGEDWTSWEPFDKDNPAGIYLTSLPEPPTTFQMPGEVDRTNQLMDYIANMTVDENGMLSLGSMGQSEMDKLYASMYGEQAEISPFMQQGTWESLEPWQRVALSIFSPQPMENRPESSRMAASLFQGIQAGMGGWAAGTVLGNLAGGLIGAASGGLIGAATGTAALPGIGTAIGIIAGLGVGGAATYQAYTGTEIPGINKLLEFLDIAAITTEKIVGLGVQMADGETKEVLENLPEAWKAGEFTYEATRTGTVALNLMSGGAQAIETFMNDTFKTNIEWSSGQTADFNAGEIWALERAIVEPVLAANGVLGGESLDKIRSELIGGADFHDIYADWLNNYGFSGNVGDFIAQSVLDPLQFMPAAQNAAIGKIAGYIKDPGVRARVLASVKVNKGSIAIDVLPFGWQQLAQALTPKSIHSSGGVFDVMRTYKNMLRHGYLDPGAYLSKTIPVSKPLSLTNPDSFSDPGQTFINIQNSHITAGDSPGVMALDLNAVKVDYTEYINSELQSIGVDISDPDVKAVVDSAVEDIPQIVLDTRNNRPGTNEAEFNTNVGAALKDHIDTTIMSMKWGEGTDTVKYYPPLTEWERKFANLTDEGGFAELQRNQPGGLFRRLSQLTPESQVAIFLDLAHTNMAGLLQIYGDSPDLMVSIMKQAAGIDPVSVGLAAEAMMQSPATKTVAPALKSFVESGLPDQLLASMHATAETRVNLETMAQGLDMNPSKLLGEIENNPAAVIQMLKNAEQAGDLGALQPFVDQINAGLLDAEGLKDLFGVFMGKDYVPWNTQLFQAELVQHMAKHMDKFLVEHYGIEPKPWFYRLSSALKSAQSLMVLGFNPLYTIYNYVNNVSTRAAQGVFGFMTPGQIDNFWNRFGVKPSGLSKGVGLADLQDVGHRGGQAVAAAMDVNDWIGKFRKASSKAAKLGIFSNLAAKIEVAESRQATTIGAMQAWTKLWKEGVGYQKLPGKVEAQFRQIHPQLPERLYSLVNQGLNIDEISKSLYTRSKFQGVENALNRAVQDVFANNPEKARDIIEKTGIKQILIKAIGDNPTMDDIERGYDHVLNRLESIVQQTFYEDLVIRTEDVANRVRAEGWAAMMPICSEMWGDYTVRRLNDLVLNQIVSETAGAMRAQGNDEGARQLWRSRLITRRQQWGQTHSMMKQSARGMIDAIGTTNPSAHQYVNLMVGWMDGWEKFYLDTEAEWQKYYTSDLRGREKNALYKSVLENNLKLHDQHRQTEAVQLTQMFEALARVYEETSQRPGSEVMAWGQEVIKAFEETSNKINEFRDAVMNTEHTPTQLRQAFETFNTETFKPLIFKQRDTIINGAQQLTQLQSPIQPQGPAQPGNVITTPLLGPGDQGGDVSPTTPAGSRFEGPEILRDNLKRRAEHIGPYDASDAQRNLLAGILSKIYPNAEERHAVQRYLFDTNSVKMIRGEMVKAGLDTLISVGIDGEDIQQIPDNIRVQLEQVLQAARDSEGQESLFGQPAQADSDADKAQYNERKIKQETDRDIQDKQVNAAAAMTRETFTNKLGDTFKLTRTEQSAVMALVDAHAEVWGKRNGKSAAAWFTEKMADIEYVETNADWEKIIKERYPYDYDIDGLETLGMADLLENGKAIIRAGQNADLSVALHELAHVWRWDMDPAEIETLAKWTGIKDAKTFLELERGFYDGKLDADSLKLYEAAEEKFANGFLKYINDRMAMDAAPPAMLNVFRQFADWMRAIYKTISGSKIDIEISPEMKRVYDRLMFDNDVVNIRDTRSQKLKHMPAGDKSVAQGVISHTYYNVQFQIVEAADLITSHTPNFDINKLYLQELQTKKRDEVGYQKQVMGIERELIANEVLLDTKLADAGPPVVGPDMMVESGNGRTLALLRMIKNNPGEFQSNYVAALQGMLQDYGFAPEALEGIENPILVRVRLDDVDRVEFAKDANEPRVSKTPPIELAMADADRWSNEMLARLQIGETQDIEDALLSPSNAHIINDFKKGMTDNDLISIVNEKGEITRQGVDRLRASLLAKVFGTEKGLRILKLFGESTDPLVRNFERAIEIALGDIVSMEALIAEERRPQQYSITDDISDIISSYLFIKQSGQTIDDWFNSISALGEDRYIDVGLYEPGTPDDIRKYKQDMLHYFTANRRSAKAVATFLKRYAQSVIAQPEAAQMSLIVDMSRPPRYMLAMDVMASLVRDKTSKPFGDYGQQGAPLFQTRPIGEVPLAGTPTPQYEGMVRSEVYNETLIPLLEQMKEHSLNDMQSGTAFSLADIPEGLNDEVGIWLNSLSQDMAGTKMAAMRYGEMQRNRALLNYQQRYGIDDVAQMVFPYEFWFTRTMGEWAKRAIEKPAWIAMYARLRRHQKRMEQEGIPSRLKGKLRIPAPFLPDWMGDGLYVDPLKQLFPFAQFAVPFEMLAQQGTNVERTAIQYIQDLVKSDQITATQAKEIIQTREGPIWNQALAEAQTELTQGGQLDAMNLTSMLMTPAMWWTYPYHILKGTPEQLYPLPGTRTGQALREFGGPLGVIGNIMTLPEETIRRKFNLSAYGEWGDYYVDRMLANMAGEGVITSKDAQVAMIERQGEIYDMAYDRMQKEMAMKIPGSQTAVAIQEGKLGGVLYTLPTTLFPAGILPEGELIQRGLKQEYSKAWDSYKNGNPQAINDFFEKHPEYQARLALFDEPEERLQQFLVSEIWEKWQEIDNKNKTLITEQLGRNFETMFLDKETRDYTAIDNQTLAHWAQLLGGVVPNTEGTGGASSIPLYQQDGLTIYRPEVLQQVDAFYEMREQQFPNYKFLQEIYFDLPESPKSMRYDFIEEYPELKAYWEWKDAFYRDHPDVAAYQEEQEKRFDQNRHIYTGLGAPQITPEEASVEIVRQNMDPALQMQLLLSYHSNQEVSGGARRMLMWYWTSLGEPTGDFSTWASMVLGRMVE